MLNITISTLAGTPEASLRRCPVKKAELESHLFGIEPRQKWMKKPNQDGLFMITDEIAKDGQFWKVDYAERDFQSTERLGVDIKQGDLIVQLLKNMGENYLAPVWPMILRPVQP